MTEFYRVNFSAYELKVDNRINWGYREDDPRMGDFYPRFSDLEGTIVEVVNKKRYSGWIIKIHGTDLAFSWGDHILTPVSPLELLALEAE